MYRLDKTQYRSGHIQKPQLAKEQYRGFGHKDLLQVAYYLCSVAYDFPIDDPPRMDRTAFSSRKEP